MYPAINIARKIIISSPNMSAFKTAPK